VATTLACALTFAAPSLLSEGSSAGFGLADFTALDYALTQPGVLLHYLRLVVWPVGLCFDPGWPIARAVGEWLPQSLVVGALLATSIALLLRRSWMGFAGVGFFLVLAPSSSIVPILDPAFEHRLYLALLFPLLFLVAAVPGLCVRPRPDARWLPTLLVGAAVLLSTALTLRRNHDYRSAFELWRLTAQQAPHNKRAHLNLGAMLLDANRVEEAIEALLKSLALDPLNADANLNLGNAFMRKGESKRALPFLVRAEEALGDVACADALGRALLLEGDPARAAEYLERAVAGSPDEARLHRLLATAYEGAGALERALEEYRRALVLEPDHAQARARVRELEGHGQDPRNGPRARPDKPGASRDPERP
jgi:Flp pilus assembly protein TadD